MGAYSRAEKWLVDLSGFAERIGSRLYLLACRFRTAMVRITQVIPNSAREGRVRPETPRGIPV